MNDLRMLLLYLAIFILGGCVSDQQRVDIGKNAQVIYNAATSLPPSPQVTAIQLNAAAIGNAVGWPVNTAALEPKVSP